VPLVDAVSWVQGRKLSERGHACWAMVRVAASGRGLDCYQTGRLVVPDDYAAHASGGSGGSGSSGGSGGSGGSGSSGGSGGSGSNDSAPLPPLPPPVAVDVRYYHGGMSPAERDATHRAFLTGNCRVVVATVAFGPFRTGELCETHALCVCVCVFGCAG
jgi:hypothetical protein